MSKPAKPAAAKKEDAAVAVAPHNNKKLVIIIAALVLIIAGGAAWFFLMGQNPAHEEVKVEAPKVPTFIPLETFTVNLQRESYDQYLQVDITLKVMEPELEGKIKAASPEIRSKLNMLLSSKRPSELAVAEGKKKLAADIAVSVNNVLGFHNASAAHAASGEAPTAEHAADDHAAPQEHTEEGDTAPQEHTEAAATEVAAPAHATSAAGAEKKGVVDVLFTSFIIQ